MFGAATSSPGWAPPSSRCPVRSIGCEPQREVSEARAPWCSRRPTPRRSTAARCRGPSRQGRPARAAGSMVVLVDGEAVAYLDRGGRSLVTFPTAADDDRWTDALAGLVKDGRLRSLELQRIDGEPALHLRRRTPTARRSASSTATEVSSSGRDPPRARCWICCPEGDGSGPPSLRAPMPEGDTIHRTAARLRPALIGRRLEQFEAPRLVGLRPAVGSVIEAVEATGKHLEITLRRRHRAAHAHAHGGSWHLYRPGRDVAAGACIRRES